MNKLLSYEKIAFFRYCAQIIRCQIVNIDSSFNATEEIYTQTGHNIVFASSTLFVTICSNFELIM